MQPLIDLAPGAEDNALAVRFAQHLRQNLADRPHKVPSFAALRAAVLVVVQDRGESFTMRFDHGRLTIHDGTVGIPTVTFCADEDVLLKTFDLPLGRFLRLPIIGSFGGARGESFRGLLRRYASGELLIYGILSHPRTVARVLRALSTEG